MVTLHEAMVLSKGHKAKRNGYWYSDTPAPSITHKAAAWRVLPKSRGRKAALNCTGRVSGLHLESWAWLMGHRTGEKGSVLIRLLLSQL